MTRARVLRIAKIVSTTVAVAVALGAALLTVIVPRVTGSVSLTVLTGSMSPTIPAGSMVLVKPLDPSGVREGDVITFQAEPGKSSYITHRVIDIEDEGGQLSFITKGDANRGEDKDPVPAGAVRGRVLFHVPHVGTLADRVRTPAGMLGLIALPAAFYLISQARELVSERRRNGDSGATKGTADDLSVDGDGPRISRGLVLARAVADAEGRRQLAAAVGAMGGSVLQVQGDHIVVMLAADASLLDELERHLVGLRDAEFYRSATLSIGVAEVDATTWAPDLLPAPDPVASSADV